MPRRKLEDENVRSLHKVSGGRSYGITLPLRRNPFVPVAVEAKVADYG